mgnify:CR=1 FL=1
MRVGSVANERIKGLTRIVSGLRAKYTPGRALLCPTSRPPEPQHPVINVFHRGGLRCGCLTTQNRDLITENRDLTATKRGGNCTIRGTTRRQHAEGSVLVLQNPRHYPWGQAPSLAQCSLTGAVLPGRVPINAGRASPAMTGRSRAASSATRLVPDGVLHPIGKIQSLLIRLNLP